MAIASASGGRSEVTETSRVQYLEEKLNMKQEPSKTD